MGSAILANPSTMQISTRYVPTGRFFAVRANLPALLGMLWAVGLSAQPVSTELVGKFTNAGEVSGVSVTVEFAYAACRGKGLRVIDYRHPNAQGVLREVGSWTWENSVSDLQDVQVSGEIACVADHSYGLHVLNVAATSPVYVGSVRTGPNPSQSGQPVAVHVSGDYAYLAMNGTSNDRGKRVHIFKVRDANNANFQPLWVGEIKANGGVFDVHVQGKHCYLVDKQQYLTVCDISTPSLPKLEYAIKLPAIAEYVFATDTHVFVSTGAAVGGNQGVHVYNAAGLGYCSQLDISPAHALKVSGNLAYIARREYGFQVRDVTGPCHSTVVASGNPSGLGQAQAVDVMSPYLFLGSGQGLFVVQVGGLPLEIPAPGPLPAGRVGNPYAYTLAATGGVPPYSWDVVGGSLPPGLVLSEDGVVTGVPTQSRLAEFTVQVSDGSGQLATAQLQLLVEQPTLLVDYCAVLTVPCCVGTRFAIQYSTKMQTPVTWHTLTNITMTPGGAPYVYVDWDGRQLGRRFYRAIPLE